MLEEELQEEQQMLEEEPQHEEELFVNYALTWDVTGTAAANLHLERNGEGNIWLWDDCQLDEPARMPIVICATTMMDYNNPKHTKSKRARITKAACTLVCYDLGYKKVFRKTMVESWIKKKDDARMSSVRNGLKSKHKGRPGSTIDYISSVDETYLHKLYQNATEVHGNTLMFLELATSMNQKITADQILPEPVTLSEWQVKRWFHSWAGRQFAPSEKPYLTAEQIEARVRYSNRIKELQRQWRKIAYLDKSGSTFLGDEEK